MKKINPFVRNTAGFTLIELIIVLAILGLLAALAVPRFTTVLENSQVKTDQANLAIVETALEVYKADHEGQAPTITEGGEGTDFDKLVQALKTAEYLKDAKIVNKSKGTFKYINGIVSFEPFVAPSP